MTFIAMNPTLLKGEGNMTKLLTSAAVAAILASLTIQAMAVVYPSTSGQGTSQTRCLIQGDGLNIRATPDLNGNLVATLEPSDTVFLGRVVIGRENRRWAYVEVDGEGDLGGWASFKYLSCQGDKPHRW